MPTAESTRLIVFSDDWARHPSSCQHLIQQLLPRYRVLWVNTVGTRRPSLSWGDVRKAAGKLRQWSSPPAQAHDHLTVVTPRMWPGFRSGWQRRLNARQIARAVNGAMGPRRDGECRIAVTTLPITADLIAHSEAERGAAGKLDVDRWVYYCVDDFSVWPGADGQVMQQMDELQAGRVDRAVAVSTTLQDRIAGFGKQAALLTHGIDLAHWSPGDEDDGVSESVPAPSKPDWWPQASGSVYLFWGLIDPRMDANFCRALIEPTSDAGTLLLVGPKQAADTSLTSHARIVTPGPMPYDALPALASAADVLVMPYRDEPVTRAIQPLKLKEYLATGKPVVVRDLPANRAWADACDLAADAATFARLAHERATGGLPPDQATARARLKDETWQEKALEFERMLIGESDP